MARKAQPFRLTSGDRKMLEVAGDDLTLFCQYYFNGWTPLAYQHAFYHAPQRNKLLLAGIRAGKTKGVAAGFLHYGVFHPESRLANASISADQAQIVFNDVVDFASRPRFEHWVEDVSRHPYPKVRLVNGTEIWFRSVGYEAELWRGWEFDWINVDEAAYVPSKAAIDTLLGRLVGTRQVNGIWVPRAGLFSMTSSPKGKTWLFERWKLGDPEYLGSQPERYLSLRARTRDNIYLTPEQVDDLMENYTSKQVQQELDGLFVDADGAQFSYAQVMYACTPIIKNDLGEVVDGRREVSELQEAVDEFLEAHRASTSRRQDLDFFELPPERGRIYVNSWDLGKRPTKLGRNAMVGGVLDITTVPWRLVAYRYAPGASFGMAHAWIKEWHARYGGDFGACETIIDATGKGDVLNEQLTEEDNLNISAFVYSAASKPQLIHSLAIALERGLIVFPFVRRLVDQLQGYELPDDRIPQDIVMMLGQAAYAATQRGGSTSRSLSVVKPIISAGRRPIDHPDMARFAERRRAMQRRTGRR